MGKQITLFFVLFTSFLSMAQKKNESFRLHIKKTTSPIVIDGVADDPAWEDTEKADDFFMVLPMDNRKATEMSEIRMAYDDKHIYLIATFFNTTKGQNIVESLRRDFSFGKNDNFLLFLDPFNNQTTGFSFGSNAAGAQWDGTMFGGSSIDLNWDSKWISKVVSDEDKWVFEMAVPFKSIRYKDGVREWGINFSRLDLKASEKSSWTPIPRQFPTASLAYTGVLVWDQPPPSQGSNISIIPYVLSSVSNDLEGESSFDKKVGGDVKIGLTSSLNLDLTVNPDFSQVEVDRQVTNLDRFELFFPEKRQFFLENGDLFANFGYSSIRPFFSRRIGLGVPIRAGARVSGNLNEKWRLGVMDMQTAAVDATGLPSQNFGVLTLQRKVFGRSSIGLMVVNKESINYPQENDSITALYPKFNRNVGMEYNLASSNNMWDGKAFLLKSFSPDDEGNGITQAAHLEYKSRKWNWRIQEESVGENYRAEVGYVPRNGYIKTQSFLGYLFFPKSGQILSHGPTLNTSYYFNEDFERTDNTSYLLYSFAFRNRSSLDFFISDDYVELLSPFDPTRLGKQELAVGTKHRWNAFGWMYASKPQSLFTYTFDGRLGGYYEGGNRTSLSTELGYRFQPYVSLSANLNYNRIKMPAPWNTNEFWLIGSEVDITFTNKLFFSNLFQYNEQSKNFNLNSRFQWRYKPASDLFIVYTNNHLLDPYNGRTWSLTLKLNYWFNP
ncbi:carbohydrate binding family 9 domain-containing protein [Maribacter sp. ANRC-HE7]|uniref:Carbohydrate binding family 9 domain-containing protein n=2 Tax=Maribacter aquimaris TaxID=2737171 RepID=A0ABR7UZ61_9FLAO|nr:carbohydrate binding family 9 domain-containing protein [Maribacter aquimaris]